MFRAVQCHFAGAQLHQTKDALSLERFPHKCIGRREAFAEHWAVRHVLNGEREMSLFGRRVIFSVDQVGEHLISLVSETQRLYNKISLYVY